MFLRKGPVLLQEMCHGIGIFLEIDLIRLSLDRRDRTRISPIKQHSRRVAEVTHMAGRTIKKENARGQRSVVPERAVDIPADPARFEKLAICRHVVHADRGFRHAHEKFADLIHRRDLLVGDIVRDLIACVLEKTERDQVRISAHSLGRALCYPQVLRCCLREHADPLAVRFVRRSFGQDIVVELFGGVVLISHPQIAKDFFGTVTPGFQLAEDQTKIFCHTDSVARLVYHLPFIEPFPHRYRAEAVRNLLFFVGISLALSSVAFAPGAALEGNNVVSHVHNRFADLRFSVGGYGMFCDTAFRDGRAAAAR